MSSFLPFHGRWCLFCSGKLPIYFKRGIYRRYVRLLSIHVSHDTSATFTPFYRRSLSFLKQNNSITRREFYISKMAIDKLLDLLLLHKKECHLCHVLYKSDFLLKKRVFKVDFPFHFMQIRDRWLSFVQDV